MTQQEQAVMKALAVALIELMGTLVKECDCPRCRQAREALESYEKLKKGGRS